MTNEEALDEIFNFIPKSILEQIKEEGAYKNILSGKIKTGAEVYDFINEEHASLQDADYSWLLDILKPHFNEGSVLQIGCGRGDLLMRCADAGYNPIYGIDRSKIMLNEAKYRLESYTNIKLFPEKIENFNFTKLDHIKNVIMNNFWGMIDKESSINLLISLKKCISTSVKIFIGSYTDKPIGKKRLNANNILKNNLGFTFSFGFFTDFDSCGYNSTTIKTGKEKYFILTLK